MNDLTDQKLKEEIALLKAERRGLRHRFLFDITRTILVFGGALFVFWLLQNPESILKREHSKNSMSIERYKIIREILAEKDTARKKQLVEALKVTFTDGNEWLDYLNFIAEQTSQESALKAVASLSNNKELLELVERKKELVKNLNEEFEKEIIGKGPSGFPGMGPVAFSIRKQIEKHNKEIEIILHNLVPQK